MRSIQKDFERIGAEGCYFLSLVRGAELERNDYIDAYSIYKSAVSARIIDENCFVNSPAGLMALMVGGRWSVEKTGPEYEAKPGEIVVFRYERAEGMKTIAHFVLGKLDGTVEYDPYGDSLTVARGNLVSKRVLRRV